MDFLNRYKFVGVPNEKTKLIVRQPQIHHIVWKKKHNREAYNPNEIERYDSISETSKTPATDTAWFKRLMLPI